MASAPLVVAETIAKTKTVLGIMVIRSQIGLQRLGVGVSALILPTSDSVLIGQTFGLEC